MASKPGTYDTDIARKIDLKRIVNMLSSLGASDIYVKKLSPNDNSKNQLYLGGHLTDLSFLPTGEIEVKKSSSTKTNHSNKKIIYQAPLHLKWVDPEGNIYPAPNAKLIYYPQYPEVRFSGFLKGSSANISQWMDPKKMGRAEGRWLIMGVSNNKTVYSYLASPDSNLAQELRHTTVTQNRSALSQIHHQAIGTVLTDRQRLTKKLLEIHDKGWIAGKKMGANGTTTSYKASNAGGYTLEALLDIPPNGIAEPDYHGWEIKQFRVREFPKKGAQPTTLMTPEPNGGRYATQGAEAFIRHYGYAAGSGKPDRLNFGGIHKAYTQCKKTKLTMKLQGFNRGNSSITNASGEIALMDNKGNVAASWSFPKMMNHWKRKHSQAAYIPCQMRPVKDWHEYRYGSDIELGIGTDFEMFLSAMAAGHVYYDPGMKVEKSSSSRPKIKRRSQFRTHHLYLCALYKEFKFVDLNQYR